MKMIFAYIRHEAFEPIRQDLLERGFPSMSVSEVKGSGRQKGITERYRGAEVVNYLRPKIKLECAVSDDSVEAVVDGADPGGLRFRTEEVLDRVEEYGDLFDVADRDRAPLPAA